MKIKIVKAQPGTSPNRAYLITDKAQISDIPLNDNEKLYIKDQLDEDVKLVIVNRFNGWLYVIAADHSKGESTFLEECRRKGNEIIAHVRKEKITSLEITCLAHETEALLAFVEGLALGSYDFVKYKSKKDEKRGELKDIYIIADWIPEERIKEVTIITEAVYKVRDLVNEPVSYLNAEKLSEVFEAMGEEAGFQTEIFDKEKITALKMGGLLGVNRGSIDPPTFSVLEWKPGNAKNEKPVILVGKGVTFDTGGLSLKPTPNSMDSMKSDMAGGATVAAVVYAAARIGLPVHLIALVPATDNRPDGNALTPGDILYTHSGKSVEVLNTDAEGRLILADALSFAANYDPSLVIDVATLTGSAAMAIGPLWYCSYGKCRKRDI